MRGLRGPDRQGLNQLEGVDASVNLATEQAAVRYDDGQVALEELVARGRSSRVRRLADRAESGPRSPPRPAAARRGGALTVPGRPARHGAAASVRRLGVGGARARDPGLGLGRLALPPNAALKSLRHGAATMDTLISLGTTAAYVWSLVALLALEDAETYFEVASVITTLILLGR